MIGIAQIKKDFIRKGLEPGTIDSLRTDSLLTLLFYCIYHVVTIIFIIL